MKIALIASNRKPIPSSRDNVFAPGTIIKGLADNLTELGHKVTFFGPSDSDVNVARIISEGLKSVYSDYQQIRREDPHAYLTNEDQYEMVLISKAFKMIREEGDFDIIHAHKYNKEVFFSDFVDTPLLITGHGMYNESLFSPADKVRYERYKDSCYYVSVSDFHRTGVDLNFVAKIPWGINPDSFPFSEKPGEGLLFLGRIIQRKRPDFAIEVAEAAGEKIIVAGQKGVENHHVEYWNRIEHLFQKPHVTFLDHIPYDQTGAYLGQAKALLLPLDMGEPLPLTSLEAMACGTPIIASDISPMNEIIVNGENGFLVERGNTDAWVRAINNLGHIDRRKCREHFEREYTWRRMTERYIETYQKVIELHRTRNASN